MILLYARTFPRAHEVDHFYAHDDFAFLVQNFDAGADNAAVGPGFGAARLQDGRAHG